jgi:hypothetical protein
MKRYTWLLLTALLAGQGCLGMENLLWEREVVAVKEPVKAPPPPAPVTAATITEANAAEAAEALAEELSRLESEPLPQPRQ